MDRATQDLLRELQAGPTDLAKLIGSVLRRERTTVAVEADAMARWNRDAARHWQLVKAWLTAHGVRVTVVSR